VEVRTVPIPQGPPTEAAAKANHTSNITNSGTNITKTSNIIIKILTSTTVLSSFIGPGISNRFCLVVAT